MDDPNANIPPESEGDEEEPKSPPSRFDRLMSAKDRAEKEAERWGEIEEMGTPIPSYDQDYGVTQPIIDEPPRKSGDTPTGQDTPPEELPRIPRGETPTGRPAPTPPPFRHPTDPPLPPPDQPRMTESGEIHEPPIPRHPTDEPAVQPKQQRERRYEEPPKIRDVRLDDSGMPLPQRVPQEDRDATIAGRSSYQDRIEEPPAEPTRPRGYDIPEPQPEPQVTQHHQNYEPQYYPEPTYEAPRYEPRGRYSDPPPPPPSRRGGRRGGRQDDRRPRSRPRRQGFSLTWGCLTRTLVLTLVGGLLASILAGTGATIYYVNETVPSFRGIDDISDLQARALQFESTRIRDSEGNVLYTVNDPEGGFRDYVTINEVSPWIIHATVATEERDFFINPGFSIPAIIRAVIQNYREGQVISGASTITQQITRALLLPEEERTQRTYSRKIKEIFLAAELGRRFTKEEILELYLNQVNYGNLAYGIEAAAQTYFNKGADELTLAEASFLAGLPQAPAVWDPVTNHDAAVQRQSQVLGLMLEADCLNMGNTVIDPPLPCVNQQVLAENRDEIFDVATREYTSPDFGARYPHWVVYVQAQLEERLGPEIYTGGFDVYTTLDPELQDLAQQQVEITLSGLQDRNVGNASVIVIDVDTGAIKAMVGSRDFYNEAISGQVNVALTPQQPGSSIKPFTYIAAFRQGWSPATVIWDVPIAYEIPGFGVYEPVNYSGRFRGPVPLRYALANSYNVPAVLALDFVGVPALLEVLNDLGIDSLGDSTNPNNYGLSLTLGAGEVYLLDWTNAYATISNGGTLRPTYAIERIERNGVVIEEYTVPPGEQVLDPANVYMIRDILSDHQARAWAFGTQSILNAPNAGAKTGTTNDFRDNWTMGFNSEIAVGVWVGNTDNSQMINVTGVTGAGPIWRGIIDGAVELGYQPQAFPAPPPGTVIEQTICWEDGHLPSEYCLEHGEVNQEIFAAANQPPPADQGLFVSLTVHEFSGLIANDFCGDFVEERFYLNLPDPSQLLDLTEFERAWLTETEEGRSWAIARGISEDLISVSPPTEECGPNTPNPEVAITSPTQGEGGR